MDEFVEKMAARIQELINDEINRREVANVD
jgi:hypothetical protein